MPLPNSLPWMESVDAKMIRAFEHLQAFGKEVNDYLSTVNLQMYLKTAPDSPNPWIVFHASDCIPPIRISAIAGDCIHNMRSALDNLVCGLARKQNPSINCKSAKFFFTENEPDWNGKSKILLDLGIPEKAVEIMGNIQPWCDTITPQPLLILKELSNLDKHEACALTIGYSRQTRFRVHCINGQTVEAESTEPIYLGNVETVTLPIDSRLIGESARVESSGTYVINFRDEGPWGDKHVIFVLQRCFDHIERKVISRLKRFFET